MRQSIFNHKIPIFERLLKYGFVLENEEYVYICKILDEQFILMVVVTGTGEVRTKLTDVDTAEEYVLHSVAGVVGGFVERVRGEYDRVLRQIAEESFETQVFSGNDTQEVIQYIRAKYKNEFEFLWKSSPQNAIVRRQDNKKWYAVLLTIPRNKLGLSGDDKIEIIDLRLKKEDVSAVVDNCRIFPGFHMNKQHWITICLDGSVALEEIFRRIDESYLLANK